MFIAKICCACCKKQRQHLAIFYLYAVCDNCRKRLCAIARGVTSASRTCLLFYIRCHETFLAKTEAELPDTFLRKLSVTHLNRFARLCKILSRIDLAK